MRRDCFGIYQVAMSYICMRWTLGRRPWSVGGSSLYRTQRVCNEFLNVVEAGMESWRACSMFSRQTYLQIPLCDDKARHLDWYCGRGVQAHSNACAQKKSRFHCPVLVYINSVLSRANLLCGQFFVFMCALHAIMYALYIMQRRRSPQESKWHRHKSFGFANVNNGQPKDKRSQIPGLCGEQVGTVVTIFLRLFHSLPWPPLRFRPSFRTQRRPPVRAKNQNSRKSDKRRRTVSLWRVNGILW